MRIRPIVEGDAARWLRLRSALWPGADDEHAANIQRYFKGTLREPCEVLVADDEGDLTGFVELSIRAYAEGCDTDHVGYLEGWYVSPTTAASSFSPRDRSLQSRREKRCATVYLRSS